MRMCAEGVIGTFVYHNIYMIIMIMIMINHLMHTNAHVCRGCHSRIGALLWRGQRTGTLRVFFVFCGVNVRVCKNLCMYVCVYVMIMFMCVCVFTYVCWQRASSAHVRNMSPPHRYIHMRSFVFAWVCVYVRIQVCMYICVYVYGIFLHVRMYAMCVCMYVCVYVCMCACMYAGVTCFSFVCAQDIIITSARKYEIYTYTCRLDTEKDDTFINSRTQTHTYIQIYIHTHVHTCIHTYIHKHRMPHSLRPKRTCRERYHVRHTQMHSCIHSYVHAYIHT